MYGFSAWCRERARTPYGERNSFSSSMYSRMRRSLSPSAMASRRRSFSPVVRIHARFERWHAIEQLGIECLNSKERNQADHRAHADGGSFFTSVQDVVEEPV